MKDYVFNLYGSMARQGMVILGVLCHLNLPRSALRARGT